MKHILLLFILSGLMAQGYEKDRWEEAPVRSEKMESMMIWRLTDHLELSSDQAEKFFPRFREHREDMRQLGKDEREDYEQIREKISGDKELSRSEVRKVIDRVADLRKKRVELETKFVLGMDDILTPNQMVKLGVFKERMMREMKREVRDKMGRKEKRKRHKKKDRKRGRRGF